MQEEIDNLFVVEENPTSTSNSEQNQTVSKNEQQEKEGQELLNRVVSGNIENIKDRVAFILNNSTDARNSDTILAWEYWTSFEAEKMTGNTVTREQMLTLTKPSSLTRIRAKIQNEYKLFQADPIVKKYRGMLEDDMKQEAIEDKPTGTGLYSVYIDETGKTQEYLSVGSLWLLNYGLREINKSYELSDWKKHRNIEYEFHFTKMGNNSLDLYKEFFTKFLSLYPEVGFKLIVVNNSGFQDKNAAITDLTFHLLEKGVTHEHNSGRALLPRVLQVWLDEEEAGSDQLKLENVKERIKSQKISGLFLGDFRAVSSRNNFFVQAVDLFTGAVNRKLHFPEGTHPKDILADYILGLLKLDIAAVNKENLQADQSLVFNLSDFNV